MFKNPLPVLEKGTYTLKHTLSNLLEKPKKTTFWHPAERVCMFQNPQPVMEKETSTLKHKHSNLLKNHTLGAS